MKKVIILSACVAAFASCGNNDNAGNKNGAKEMLIDTTLAKPGNMERAPSDNGYDSSAAIKAADSAAMRANH